LSSALSAYVSPSYTPQVTLAARVGGAHKLGDFPFYGAATLGSKSNLRGFRSTRFAGRTSFYQNVDLRIELFKFSTYLAIGKAGIHGFVDNGRVWTDGETSDVWHQGYGGGLWFEMFDLFVLQATAGFSKEDPVVTMGFGFLY
jgi:outer membrane protein assembly factor BamA